MNGSSIIEQIPETARIIILEGIAGSGKSTLKEYLKQAFSHKDIFEFIEEELFLGWKQVHLPGLALMRIDYYHILLDYIERKMRDEPDTLFILERFHLSVRVLEWEFEDDFHRKYQALLDRIRRLPVFILLVKLEENKIRERMLHRERSRQWNNFIREKLKLRDYSDLETLSIDQQRNYLHHAAEQGIPYAIVTVDLKH